MRKRPKVLFIIHDVYQEDNHFPLGIAYLAAILKKNNVEVEVLCQDIFHYTNEYIADYLQEKEFDIIGIGFLAARFMETIEPICRLITSCKKNAWLVLGGAGPSPIPEYILNKTKADIVVLGEAEEIIGHLLECKIEGGDLSKVDGIAYCQNGRIFVNRRRSPVKNLDLIPFPEWSLFPMERYTRCLRPYQASIEDIALGIITSRGCINRCNFCYRLESGIRTRSIENVIQEMLILKNSYGVNYFIIYDELFVFSKKRILEFKESLKRNDLKIKFSCNARVDLFDEELAVLIKECGCEFLNFGMESSSQRVLDIMKKRTTVEQNIMAAEIARKIGIGLGLDFIWGNIGDTEESLRNNVELIKKYNTYNQLRTIRPVTPYPGSELYYFAIEKGYLKGPEEFFIKFKNSDLATVNFTQIPDDKYYRLLFEANKELILDHYFHTSGDMEAAEELIKEFYKLYFEGEVKFRGPRHYVKETIC